MSTTLERRPKETSYAYGNAHQQQMLKYHYSAKTISEENDGYLRLELVRKLVENASERLGKTRPETVVVDLGCSVGTVAIECDRMGFSTHGVDFDPEAIEIAERLNLEEGTHVRFHTMDVSDWTESFPRIDIAVAADIFEHLHDDELGALLVSLRKNLSEGGLLAFHTAPQEYDYIFWRKKGEIGRIELPWFLLPFKALSDFSFTRLVRILALGYDMLSVLRRGVTFKERLKRTPHPNPLTKIRLTDILERSGYQIVSMESGTFDVQMAKRHRAFFRSHSVTHRSLYGLARPHRDR